MSAPPGKNSPRGWTPPSGSTPNPPTARPEIIRDIATGINDDAAQTTAFQHVRQAEEHDFLHHDQPWQRATTIVAGPVAPRWVLDEIMIADGPVATTA